MTSLKLPERFGNKLISDPGLNGIVNTTLATFSDVLKASSLYFFQEYTDHGIEHVEQVIASADNLIVQETHETIIQSTDIAFFVLAAILHDLGMHIETEGFVCLLEGEFEDVRIKDLDSKSWAQLWEDYLAEARRFGHKQRKSIFGDENVIIENPPLHNKGLINENHRKLIGEFLRRNHPRLAHEIAVKGFPGKPEFIPFAGDLDWETSNLIGLIARSHGLPLRACSDYIEQKYGKARRILCFNSHAVYLMILLRLADYIQIDKGRTSPTILKSRTFASPISKLEHSAHLAIDSIDDKYNGDPERVFITAAPRDSSMYLKLRNLIKNIQLEFDISWAVLGELYGSIPLKPLIKYRRIGSNLEDENYISSLPYLADKFSFKANDEIMPLLIAPLYGNQATYGVRELAQNAIDACNELKEYLRKRDILSYEPLIEVDVIKEDAYYFIISDNGIGMDAEVIKNYFLSAGASFRRSNEWEKEFVDEQGETIVRRTGKFGIGLLSAFLIGPEICVETRKVNSETGFRFTATLNSEQIDLIKDDTISRGTTIKIKIADPAVLDKFSHHSYEHDDNLPKWFEWFYLNTPKISYNDLGARVMTELKRLPDLDQEPCKGWHRIDAPGYQGIMWSYGDDPNRHSLWCNGIKVPMTDAGSYISFSGSVISNTPDISVFDNNGVMPLSLNRNTLAEQPSFIPALRTDIYKDIIARLLTFEDLPLIDGSKIVLRNQLLNHNATSNRWRNGSIGYGINLYQHDHSIGGALHFLVNNLLVSKRGFIMNFNYFIRNLRKIDVIVIKSNVNFHSGWELSLDIKDRFIDYNNDRVTAIEDYKKLLEAANYDVERDLVYPSESRVILKRKDYDYIFSKEKKRIKDALRNKCIITHEDDHWVWIELDQPKESIIPAGFLKENQNNLHLVRENPLFCKGLGDPWFNEQLQKYIGGNVVIPFKMEDRRQLYPRAFRDLERYMQKYAPQKMKA